MGEDQQTASPRLRGSLPSPLVHCKINRLAKTRIEAVA